MLRLIALLCFAAALLHAQTPPVSMRIATETGRSEFHQGERIPLVLTFETTEPGSRMVLIDGHDRSNPGLADDRFVTSPTGGTSDPWPHPPGGVIAGVPGQALGSPTMTFHVDLNQWVRFDRPGYYRVHAIFHPLSIPRPDAVFQSEPSPIVESNDIGLNILAADPMWQKDELRAALDALKDAPLNNNDRREDAARRIIYLDTPDSIRESASLLAAEEPNLGNVLRNGLLASAHRDEAIAAMKQLLTAPDRPITPLFHQTLAELEHAPRVDLSAAVAQKTGTAKAITLLTLIENTPADSITPQIREDVIKSFFDLPPRDQYGLLEGQWNKIAGPAMIPVLRRIYNEAPPQDPELTASAVARLYELDHAQGRSVILDDMRQPGAHLPYRVLALLPDETLPELDELFADRLEHNTILHALIARYASPAIFDRVRSLYTKEDPAHFCDAPLIAYFLRVEPAFGQKELRRTLAARDNPQNRCWLSIVGLTARYNSGPGWEKVAIDSLQDPVVAIKEDAVRSLAQHGSPAAEAAVWESFRYWHEWWKNNPELSDESRSLEQVFVQSIPHATNWPLRDADFDRIRDLCISPSCKQQADEYRHMRR